MPHHACDFKIPAPPYLRPGTCDFLCVLEIFFILAKKNLSTFTTMTTTRTRPPDPILFRATAHACTCLCACFSCSPTPMHQCAPIRTYVHPPAIVTNHSHPPPQTHFVFAQFSICQWVLSVFACLFWVISY